MSDPGNALSDLQALERFIVDNDDLLALEARIGRFNIFDALRIDRAEIRHSNFLAWLLDPAESHGQGSLFLKAILMDLLKRAGEQGLPRALSPVELDGIELQGVEVRREWRSIDLLITCKDPAFVVAIENKVDSGEHSDQLQRYERIVRDEWPNTRKQFVYLTRDGEEASDEDWVPYSYADIHRVLSRCRAAYANSIGDDVLAFLDHYLSLIGSRFMDDPQIDELCQRIYKNHRQAIELIVERGRWRHGGVTGLIRGVLEADERWYITPRYTRRERWVDFYPRAWQEWLPPISTRGDRDNWFTWGFSCEEDHLQFWCGPWNTSDNSLRERVIERLTRDPQEFGMSRGRTSAGWTQLLRTVPARWDDGPPDDEQLLEAVRRQIDQSWQQAARVGDALRPIIAEWEAKSKQKPAP